MRGSDDVVTRALAPDVYALVSAPGHPELGANIGFVVTPGGVVLVDAGMPGLQWRRAREEIRKVTDKRVIALILTHAHWDHALAAALLDPGVRVIAHAQAAASLTATFADRLAALRARGGDLGAVLGGARPVAPEGLDASRAVELGGVTFELVPFAPAHTAGDLAVFVPGRGVLFAGDLVWNEVHPWAADPGMDVDGWRAALARVEALDTRWIVPGHGEPCGREAAARLAAYLGELPERARRGFRSGRPPEAMAAEAPPAGSAGWAEPSSLARSLRELYRRMAIAELKAPCRLDLPSGFAVTEGGGDARRGWLRWGWRRPDDYLDVEVSWRPRRSGVPGLEEARASLREFNAGRPQYGWEETGTTSLVVAGRARPAVLARWWFREAPEEGGPSEWVVLAAGELEFELQLGANVGADPEKARAALAILEGVAATFRPE